MLQCGVFPFLAAVLLQVDPAATQTGSAGIYPDTVISGQRCTLEADDRLSAPEIADNGFQPCADVIRAGAWRQDHIRLGAVKPLNI